MPTTKNPTVEIAILKELLTNLLELAKTRPELSSKVAVWTSMLNALPDYLVNQDGAIAEWIDKNIHDSYDHRHLSHVYPLFPGYEVLDANDKNLTAAFEKAVDLREIGSFCGWSLPHMSAIYSRLQRKESSLSTLNMFAKTCLLENFFTLGFDYREMGITNFECGNERSAPVQLDAIMGYANALQETLILTTPKRIKLLPSCPDEFGIGSAEFRFTTGKIKIEWNVFTKTISGAITALRDTDILLELPFGNPPTAVKLKKGETKKF
jgi:alpha-L-fucosidase 2